jgi:hypothetical protein
MNRKERRAAAHQQRKQDRKAGFPTTPSAVVPDLNIPEPGLPLPSLDSITPPAKPPISEARREANRQNAQHSTGPTSSAGFAASSQNRTVHGLARHNGSFRLLPMEKHDKFEALKTELADEQQPTTPTEAILVNSMAESLWLKQRADQLLETCIDYLTGQIKDPKMFSLYLRYQTTHTRAFHKCLNDLIKLRSEKRKAELGFEAQNRKEEELRIKNEQHEMKKQSQYWEVLHKDAKACHQLTLNLMQQSAARKENPNFQAEFEAELAKHGAKPATWACAEAAA